MGGLTLPERGLMFNLNFNYNVFTVFAEAELFEFLGFKIPKIIKESTEKWGQLHADLTSVGYMLNEYTDIIKTLSVPEVNFHPSVDPRLAESYLTNPNLNPMIALPQP